MARAGVDPVGIELMTPKQFHHNLKIEALTPAQANILKQDVLSVGGEAAVSRGVVSCEVARTGCILSGTSKQLLLLIEKLRSQPHGLSALAEELGRALENIDARHLHFRARTRDWTLGAKTLVIGILNVTPDSFFDGGLYSDAATAVDRGIEMASEGADIIDVGGESSRPGAEPAEAAEELERVMPVVEGLVGVGISVSIDTTKSQVAERALSAGAEMVNDISALGSDPEMAGVVARHGAAVVLMHMRGTPRTMQDDVTYTDMMAEIFAYLSARVDCATARGIDREKIVIDPGIGFGKSPEANLEILRRLGELKSLGAAVLVGTSRKSFIGKTLGLEISERLSASLAAATAAVAGGAHMVRVHDVKESVRAVRMMDLVRSGRAEGALQP